jgi:hypothetical protein
MIFSRLRIAVIRGIVRQRLKKDIAPFETMATHPGVLIPYAQFGQALEKTNLVSAKLKKLAQIRAAKQVECPF